MFVRQLRSKDTFLDAAGDYTFTPDSEMFILFMGFELQFYDMQTRKRVFEIANKDNCKLC